MQFVSSILSWIVAVWASWKFSLHWFGFRGLLSLHHFSGGATNTDFSDRHVKRRSVRVSLHMKSLLGVQRSGESSEEFSWGGFRNGPMRLCRSVHVSSPVAEAREKFGKWMKMLHGTCWAIVLVVGFWYNWIRQISSVWTCQRICFLQSHGMNRIHIALLSNIFAPTAMCFFPGGFHHSTKMNGCCWGWWFLLLLGVIPTKSGRKMPDVDIYIGLPEVFPEVFGSHPWASQLELGVALCIKNPHVIQ